LFKKEIIEKIKNKTLLNVNEVNKIFKPKEKKKKKR